MGRRAGIDRISRMAEEFGLGKTTGIDLAGESDGNIASEAYKKKVFKQDWYLGETMDAAIGQSFTLTTPLQMAWEDDLAAFTAEHDLAALACTE